MDIKTINQCLELLVELNNMFGSSSKAKSLILELGFHLKNESNKAKNGLDKDKLMKDNTELYNDNLKLIEDFNRLKRIIEQSIPKIENRIREINGKLDRIDEVHNILKDIKDKL